MNEEYKALGGDFARKIIDRDYRAARDLLAPWLHETVSEAGLQSMIENASEELPSPADFSLDGNSCTLEDLEVTEYSPPTKPLSPQITAGNFRKWMVIEFKPDPEQETGFDACFDLWMALVDLDGSLKIGYLEPTGAD